MTRRRLFPLLVMLLGLYSCGGDDGGADEGLTVVATTTVLGDVVREVAGEAASVEVLMPVGADPHDFQASASQIAMITQADLVVANGLGLEEGLLDVLAGADSDGVVILEVGPELDPLPLREAAGEDDHGGEDPHVWFDPIRMVTAAQLIADALEAVAPGGGWPDRADEYAGDLTTTDQQIASLLSPIPDDRRKLVTSHESLGYFAERYGFEVVGVVVPGGSTLSDPSSEELARLIETIRSEDVRVIFSETTQSDALVEAIGSELGDGVAIVDLYSGSLGEPGSGADTLIGMLTTNAELIAEALGG